MHGVLLGGLVVRIGGVGVGGTEVELCGICRIEASESHFPASSSEVEGLFVVEFVLFVAGGDDSLASDIEYSHFPTLKKIVRAEDVDRL